MTIKGPLFGGAIGGTVGVFTGHPILGLGLGAIAGAVANMLYDDDEPIAVERDDLSIADRGIKVPPPAPSPEQAAERLVDASRLNTSDPMDELPTGGAGDGQTLGELLSDIRGKTNGN